MDRRAFLAAVTVAGGPFLTGCTEEGGTDGDAGTPTATPDATATPDVVGTIYAEGTEFAPLRATDIPAGAAVAWENRESDGGPDHTVTATTYHDTATEWDVDVRLAPGERTVRVFEKSGVYQYYCRVHGRETMCGVVVVGDAQFDEVMPCREGGY